MAREAVDSLNSHPRPRRHPIRRVTPAPQTTRKKEKKGGNTICLTSVTPNVARRTTHIGDLRRSETQPPAANHLFPSFLHSSPPSRTTHPGTRYLPGMDLDRPRRPRDLQTWPLCGFPRAGPRARRLPFPRRRKESRNSMPPPTPPWHPPPTLPALNTPLLPPYQEDTTQTTPSPSPPPPAEAATRPPTHPPPPLLTRPPAPPPPPPLLLNSTRDPRPHRSSRLRHVKGMLGLRRMETIDEDDGMLGPLSDGDGEEEEDGEEDVRVCPPQCAYLESTD